MGCFVPPSKGDEATHQCPRADSWLLRGVFLFHVRHIRSDLLDVDHELVTHSAPAVLQVVPFRTR